MAVSRIYGLRLAESTREAWESAAAKRGVRLAVLIRDAVNAYLGDGVVVLGAEVAPVVSGRPAAKRLGTCAHDVRSWDFCEKCDERGAV